MIISYFFGPLRKIRRGSVGWTCMVAYSTDVCHPVHGKVATQSTGRSPPTPGKACFSRSAATLGRLLLFYGHYFCQPRLPFPHRFALQGVNEQVGVQEG